MADLTAANNLRILGKAYTQRYILNTLAAQTVYRGTPLWIDQDADGAPDGTVWGFTDAGANVGATDVFVGMAAENKSVVIASPETPENAGIEAYVYPTIVGFPMLTTGWTNDDIGISVYPADSGLLASTASGHPLIGTLWRVMDDYAYVLIDSPTVCAGSA